MGGLQVATSATQADATEIAVRDCCVRFLAASLKRPVELIDSYASFARLGVDSATSVFLLMELEERLGVELPVEAVYEYPTIAQLSRYIAGIGGKDPRPAS